MSHPEVGVSVALHSERFAALLADRFALEDVRQGVLRHARELAEDLRLGVTPTVAVTAGPHVPADPGFAVRVGDGACRPPALTGRGVDRPEPRALVRSIGHALVENRALLVPEAPSSVERAARASLVRRHHGIDPGPATPRAAAAPSDNAEAPADEPVSVTLLLGESASQALGDGGADDLASRFQRLQRDLYLELGMIVPTIGIERTAGLGTNEFRVRLNAVRLAPSLALAADERLVDAAPSYLRQLLDVDAEAVLSPEDGRANAIVRGEAQARCEKAQLTTWGPVEYLVLATRGMLRGRADSLVTPVAVRRGLDALRERAPHLVAAVASRLRLATLTSIQRELLQEAVSVRDLRALCEAVLALAGASGPHPSGHVRLTPDVVTLAPAAADRSVADLDVTDYAAGIRAVMRQAITQTLAGPGQTLRVYPVARALERELRALGEGFMDEPRHARLVAAVGEVIRPWDQALEQSPVIVAAGDVRRAMRRHIEIEFPWLPVLAVEELPADRRSQVIAEIPGVP